jgi:hypothetical protein
MKAAPGLLAALVAAAPMHSRSEAVPSPADNSARDDPPAPWKAVNKEVSPRGPSKKDAPRTIDPKSKTPTKPAPDAKP